MTGDTDNKLSMSPVDRREARVVEVMERLSDLIIAVLVIIAGGLFLDKPVFYSALYARYIDLTGVNIVLGIGLIVVGILIGWPRK